VKQTVIIETELRCHVLAVLHNLEARGKLHRRDVTHLFQQRQVAVGFDIAGNTRVTIPVPGTTDVTAFLAEPDVFETRFLQFVPQQQAGKAGTDNKHFTFINQRFPWHRVCRVNIFEVP